MWNPEKTSRHKLVEGWERCETEQGIPYYINHQKEQTQWDHPLLRTTMQKLRDFDNVRYAAYRTAMKLCHIQKQFHFDKLTVGLLRSTFTIHGLLKGEKKLSYVTLRQFLVDLFDRCLNSSSEQHPQPHLMAELTTNWLANLYDIGRTGTLSLESVKVALSLLASGRLMEKYRFLFEEFSDENLMLNRSKLSYLLYSVMQIAELLCESRSFGGIEPAVDSCFKGSFNPVGVVEDIFINWLMREPQTIVWLPTLHRILAARSVHHEAKCSICKSLPIVGLRYRCLKCFNYDICQECFFTGRTSKKHKLKHPTQEYCLTSTSREDTKALIKTIRNNLSRHHRNKRKLRYLPIPSSNQENEEDQKKESGSQASAASEHSSTDYDDDGSLKSSELQNDLPLYSTEPVNKKSQKLPAEGRKQTIGDQERKELESILFGLEQENKELLGELEHFLGAASEHDAQEELEEVRQQQDWWQAKQTILEAHNEQLNMQLARLRLLLGQESDSHSISSRAPLASLSHNNQHDFQPVMRKRTMYADQPAYVVTTHAGSPLRSSMRDGTSLSQDRLANSTRYDDNFRSPSPPAYGAHLQNASRSEPLLDRFAGGKSPGLSQFDLTCGSLDNTLGRTHFSLPSPSPVFHDESYLEGKEEIEHLINELNAAYPANISQEWDDSHEDGLMEILHAADQVGLAMKKFVAPQDKHKGLASSKSAQSLFRFGDELLTVVGEDTIDIEERDLTVSNEGLSNAGNVSVGSFISSFDVPHKTPVGHFIAGTSQLVAGSSC